MTINEICKVKFSVYSCRIFLNSFSFCVIIVKTEDFLTVKTTFLKEHSFSSSSDASLKRLWFFCCCLQVTALYCFSTCAAEVSTSYCLNCLSHLTLFNIFSFSLFSFFLSFFPAHVLKSKCWCYHRLGQWETVALLGQPNRPQILPKMNLPTWTLAAMGLQCRACTCKLTMQRRPRMPVMSRNVPRTSGSKGELCPPRNILGPWFLSQIMILSLTLLSTPLVHLAAFFTAVLLALESSWGSVFFLTLVPLGFSCYVCGFSC